MDENEAASECFCLVTSNTCEKPSSMGTYILKWKRCSPLAETPCVETILNLPSVTVQSTPLFLQFEAPAHGWLRTPLTISYNLHNRTVTVQDIELFVDSSDAFMYAGNKQLHFRILPKSVYKLSYNLYPLISGYVPLPRLRLILNPGNSNAVALDDLMQEMLPSHIHIMPQGKNLERTEQPNIPVVM
ncbi:trafficking protein particle complex subunit 11-like [Centruroides sculpturatus]|uniref:trafficking protein particle complex subunit 11-like n=1 Tax=Centruroides sculpturatus TaxID=218467 RepID=UPI000C6D91FD|nr:trafficking protein particle complex subunit 11-like [Centruroides sculpturatus]